MFIYIIIIVKTVSLPFLSFIVNTLIRDNIKSTHKLLHGMTDHFFLGLNGLWHVRWLTGVTCSYRCQKVALSLKLIVNKCIMCNNITEISI